MTRSTVNRDKSQQGRREEDLINYGRLLLEKKEKARLEMMHREDSAFDYKPKINRRSEKII